MLKSLISSVVLIVANSYFDKLQYPRCYPTLQMILFLLSLQNEVGQSPDIVFWWDLLARFRVPMRFVGFQSNEWLGYESRCSDTNENQNQGDRLIKREKSQNGIQKSLSSQISIINIPKTTKWKTHTPIYGPLALEDRIWSTLENGLH